MRTLFTTQGRAESHTDLALCRGAHWSASSTFAARFPTALPSASPRSSRHPPVPSFRSREVHTVAFETSREGTLTSIFRIELRSFRVQSNSWLVRGRRTVRQTKRDTREGKISDVAIISLSLRCDPLHIFFFRTHAYARFYPDTSGYLVAGHGVVRVECRATPWNTDG